MFWRRTLKLTGTLIGYGFGSLGAGFGAAFVVGVCLSAAEVDIEDNPLVPLAGVGAGAVVGVKGIGKMKEYATCSITEKTLPIERSEIVWKQETRCYTNGDKEVTEYWNVPYTRMDLKGINGPFDIRGDFRNCSSAKMRLYRNDKKNLIIDWDFICGYKA